MKHTIEIPDDDQFNLMFMSLQILLRFYMGQWDYSFQDIFPFGYGLEVLPKEHKALYTLINAHTSKVPFKISIYNKKLDNKVRIVWDIVQQLRHHTWLLKTKEERKAEPAGKQVMLIGGLEPLNIEVVE